MYAPSVRKSETRFGAYFAHRSVHMRYLPLATLLLMTAPAFAADKEPTVLAAMHVEESHNDVHLLGKLNVNTATREQLQSIAALEPSDVDALLAARAHGTITSLAAFDLSDEALDRLTVKGPSTLRRIRALPLEVFAPAPQSAAAR